MEQKLNNFFIRMKTGKVYTKLSKIVEFGLTDQDLELNEHNHSRIRLVVALVIKMEM